MSEIEPMAKAAEKEGFFQSDTFVALYEERLVGFVSILGDEITWLYVDPEAHGHGIGRRLIEHVLLKMGQDAFVTAVIENGGGLRFYEKMGFQICAMFPGDCQGYRCTCVRLALPGSRHINRPPQPVRSALILSGFTEADWGAAYLDEDRIWRWGTSQNSV